MHLLIPIFFNAPQGGLHDNVRATVHFLLARQHRVTVVCRPGPFANQLREEGVGVIETSYDFGSLSASIDNIKTLHKRTPIDLIHSHPFASRELGMIAAQVLGLPCVVTMHGKYLDKLSQNIDKLDAVLTVSEGIRHYLLTNGEVGHPEKFYVVPNTPNANLFKAIKVTPTKEKAKGRIVISLVTRLDQDKAFILDIFYQAVAYAAKYYSGCIHWCVVGQGTLQKAFSERVEALLGENSISYTGWLQGEKLRDAYCQSDAVIAPGRCALEAMNCGIPAIALGSKGYIGLVDSDRWQVAVYSNFGGVGNKHSDYAQGSVEKDLNTLMQSKDVRSALGIFCQGIVHHLFDSLTVNQRLFGIYENILKAHQLNPLEPVSEEEFLELRLLDVIVSRPVANLLNIEILCHKVEGLRFAWHLIKNGNVVEKIKYQADPRVSFIIPGDGDYQVRCFLQDECGRKMSFIKTFLNVRC